MRSWETRRLPWLCSSLMFSRRAQAPLEAGDAPRERRHRPGEEHHREQELHLRLDEVIALEGPVAEAPEIGVLVDGVLSLEARDGGVEVGVGFAHGASQISEVPRWIQARWAARRSSRAKQQNAPGWSAAARRR